MRGVKDDRVGIIRNIFFENITCRGENAILMYASDETKLQNIFFTNFDFILKKSALDKVSGGNFDLRPNLVQGKEIYKSDIPVVYIENAENVYFNQGNIGWDGVEADYYTYAVEAVEVNNLKLIYMTVAASPSNKSLKAVSLKNCTRVINKSEDFIK
jgi:hypothetical protein